MTKTVENYIQKNKYWDTELRELQRLCLKTNLKEEIKWGAPCYTLDGKNIVGLAGFKTYVGLWFHQGVFINDKYDLLEQSNDATKGLRKMMFQSLEEIERNKKHIQEYIQEAIRNHKAGKEIKISRSKKLEVPPELENAFEEDESLQQAFNKFTPGKQREFADYIRSAKQAATKERRIKKISELIMKGVGLHDKYK